MSHKPLGASRLRGGATMMRGVVVMMRGGTASGNGVLSAATLGAVRAVVGTECSRAGPDSNEQISPGNVRVRIPGRVGTGGRGVGSCRTALARAQRCPTRDGHGRSHHLLCLLSLLPRRSRL